jgi:Mn2+/Fe2+ NRAMP family transporter
MAVLATNSFRPLEWFRRIRFWISGVGTTITPYLFFWQASQEVEEELKMGRTTLAEREGATDRELKWAEIDVDTGMVFAGKIELLRVACKPSRFSSQIARGVAPRCPSLDLPRRQSNQQTSRSQHCQPCQPCA